MVSAIVHCLVAVLVGYLLGSIPFGLLIGRRAGVDVRQTGSGKTGATNVMRSVGLGPGLLVAVGDTAKGVAAVLIAQHILASPAALGPTYANLAPWAAAAAALAAVAGHNYPIYVGFKGGRGVATTGGIALALALTGTLIGAVFFVVPILITRYVSLGSIIGAAVLPFTYLIALKLGIEQGSGGLPTFLALLIAGIAIIVSHNDNIKRLLAGTERKFGEKASPTTSPEKSARPYSHTRA